MKAPAGLAPLRHRDFALYYSGLTISAWGEWVETTTSAWLLYELTGSPVLLGLNGAIRAAAIIGSGLVGGAIVDRLPRRSVLVLVQFGSTLTSLILGLLVLWGSVAPWQIYLAGGVSAALGAVDALARRALYPALVPRSELQSASTLNASAYRVARFTGPAVAGLMIASFGPAISYFVNAATYGAFIYALLALRAPSAGTLGAGTLWSQMRDGITYTLRMPVLGWLTFLESVYSLFGVNIALVTIIGKDVLRVGPEGIGLLLGALGAGTLAGTALLILLGEIERKGRVMLASGAIYVGMFLLFGWSARYELSLALLIGLGATDAIWSTMRTTIFQLQAHDLYRGRTMSVLLLAARGLGQAGQFESGVAAAAVGPPLACVLGAGIIGGSLVVVNAVNDRVRLFRAAYQ